MEAEIGTKTQQNLLVMDFHIHFFPLRWPDWTNYTEVYWFQQTYFLISGGQQCI